GAFMRETVERALEDVDLVCAVVDVTGGPHPDPETLATLERHRAPAYCVLNKIDRLRAKTRLLPLIDAWRATGRFPALVPASALGGATGRRPRGPSGCPPPQRPGFLHPRA